MRTTVRFFSLVLLGLGAVTGYFLLTPQGSWAVCRLIFSRGFGSKSVSVGHVEGSMLPGLQLHYLHLDGLPHVPAASNLRVRLMQVSLPLLHPHQPDVMISNARLEMPDSEPILISGFFHRGVMQLNVYSRRVDAREVLRCFMNEEDAQKFSGPVGPVDLNLTGVPRRFELSGDFQVPQLNYYGFSLMDGSGAVSLKVRPGAREDGLIGEVRLQAGTLVLKNSQVQLEPSRIFYQGDPKKPVFDLAGISWIEKIRINITLKGTFRQPDLILSSDPPLPQQQLLLMLATGKRWKSMEGVSREGQLPLDMVNNFIDFAVFGGPGNPLAQQLGVEATLLVGEGGKTAGVGVSKSLSDRVGVRYGLEQSQGDLGQAPSTRQKVGAELDVTETDKVSVEAETEVIADETVGASKTKEPERSGKVLLKYKKKF